MKIYLFILAVLLGNTVFSQVQKRQTPLMVQARIYLNKSHASYNPAKAVEIYKQCAAQGNARAMNILAIMYSEGTGTERDAKEALRWFELSAAKNYHEAFFNLGNLYRTGWGIEQNFKKAYQWYEKGLAFKAKGCFYNMGYMQYKGLGCQQNYEKAISFFRKGIKEGSLGSMYMLGLCFRNGYGITQNTDSARYWLERAASKGYRFAKEELANPQPENSNSQATASKGKKNSSVLSVKTKPYNTFRKLAHTAKDADLAGEYSGFVIRYDWSGQHIIGTSPIKLRLESQEKKITGFWMEGELPAIALQADLNDTALVFNNSGYQAADHYSVKAPIHYLFRDANLQVVKQKDSVYLAGNVQLWSVSRNEPEKPVFISLTKKSGAISSLVTSAQAPEPKSSAVSEFIVYPNPFASNVQVNFSLEHGGSVGISIADLSGRIVHAEPLKQLPAGKHSMTLKPVVPDGIYVLKLSCDGIVKATLIIKQ